MSAATHPTHPVLDERAMGPPTPTSHAEVGLALLRAERLRFRTRALRVAGAVLVSLGPVFALSEFAEQGALHNAFLLSLSVVGATTFGLTMLGQIRAATVTLILGVMPAIGWVHVFGPRAELSVMYLVPVLVLGMVVSDRRVGSGLAAATVVAAVAIRGVRWGLGIDDTWGDWLTPSFDSIMVLATTAAMVDVGLRRTERNESILREAIEDRERHAEAARHASDEKSAFLARVSHELRTPLNAILGYTEIVQEEEALSTTAEEDLARVHQSAHQLLALIDRVLDLSKVEAGRLELHLEEVDIAGLLETVRSTVQPLVHRNDNRLVVTHDAPATATLDRARVIQVLLNLVSNAARFTRAGTISLHVREEPGVVVFDVQDTGIGIEGGRIPALFQPFIQASPETARDFGGTGLGLALCDRFVRRMGGHIDVHSVPGVGSTFRVVLPATGEPTHEGAEPVLL